MKNPYYVVGLGIPDLTPGFSKTYNSIIKKSVLNKVDDVQQIQNGIEGHYKADKFFHNTEGFKELMQLTTQSFLSAGLSRERLRLSVISHVAVELMIDRQILLENEQLCTDYYTLLESASEETIERYFDMLNLPELRRDFLIKFQFFKQRRFIYLFKEIENMVEGLSRIYYNVTRVAFTEAEKINFLTSLNNIDPTIRYRWKEILNVKTV